MFLTLAWWPLRARNHAVPRTEPRFELTDAQWLVTENLFPRPAMTRRGGRPRVPPRGCLEGILWVLRKGARWKDLPIEISALLKTQGLKVPSQYVSTIKTMAKAKGKKKAKKLKRKAARAAAGHGGMGAVNAAVEFIKSVGSLEQAKAALGTVEDISKAL